MVPVDFICDATEYLAQQDSAAGKAYHVLPHPAVTMGELAAALFTAFGLRPPPFSTPPWLGRFFFKTFPALSRALQFPPEVFAYMKHDVEYDTRNLDAAAGWLGHSLPITTRLRAGDGRLCTKQTSGDHDQLLARERNQPGGEGDNGAVTRAGGKGFAVRRTHNNFWCANLRCARIRQGAKKSRGRLACEDDRGLTESNLPPIATVESLREGRRSGSAKHRRSRTLVFAIWVGTSDGIQGERHGSKSRIYWLQITSAALPGGYDGNFGFLRRHPPGHPATR